MEPTRFKTKGKYGQPDDRDILLVKGEGAVFVKKDRSYHEGE